MIDFINHLWPLLINGVGVVLAAGVIVGAVCRVDRMGGWRKTRVSYFLMYLGIASWAFGIGIDLVRQVFVDWYTYVGLGGVFLHFLLTMNDWKDGPPKDAQTQPGELM